MRWRRMRGFIGLVCFCVIVPTLTVSAFAAYAPVMILMSVVRPSAQPRVVAFFGALWARLIFTLMPGWRIRAEGMERVREMGGRPMIVASNHQGNADVLAAYSLPLVFRFLAKESIFRVPVLGVAARMAGYVPVRRDSRQSRSEAFQACADALAGGHSVWFFPEGTRSPDGAIHAFRPGAFRLSIQTGVPVLPVVIRGTRELHPKGSLMVMPGLVRLRALDPVVALEGEDEIRFAERVRAMIVEAFERM